MQDNPRDVTLPPPLEPHQEPSQPPPLAARSSKDRVFPRQVATFYAALFVVYGLNLPYLPVWLDHRGLSAAEVAVVVAAPFFLRVLVSPLIAAKADRDRAHRETILVLGAAALAAALILSQMTSLPAIFIAALGFMIAVISIMPLIETIAVAGVRAGGHDYGRMRLWGSLTFIAASFGGGWAIGIWGGGVVIWLIAAGTAAVVAAALMLPTQKLTRARPERNGDGAARKSRRAPDLGAARSLMAKPIFVGFLIAGGCLQAAHATLYTFGSLAWAGQGITPLMIGVLWAIGVAAEILLFAFSGAVVRRVGIMPLLIAGGAAAVVRWCAMAAEPGVAVLVVLQILHGLTYGGAHLAAIHFLGAAVPDDQAGTGQALYGSVAAGLAMGLATLASGPLYAAIGDASYLAMAAIAGVGMVAALWVSRRWDGKLV